MRELVTGVAARWDKVAAHSLSIGKFSFLGGRVVAIPCLAVAEDLDTRLVARATSYFDS